MLEVLNGVHAGSTHIQKSGLISIGSAPENDVILFASDAYPNHFEIALTSGLVSKLLVRPIDAPVSLEDGSIVEVGQEAEIATDEIISFSGTEIAVSRMFHGDSSRSGFARRKLCPTRYRKNIQHYLRHSRIST